MRKIEVKPKNGWKNATSDEMQKKSANMIGNKHCLNPEMIYSEFNKINVYLPSIMHYFMDNDSLMEANGCLLDFLLNENEKAIFDRIGKDYKTF